MTAQLERSPGGQASTVPRVGFPLSHLLINCLIGAAMWAGLIALIVWVLA